MFLQLWVLLGVVVRGKLTPLFTPLLGAFSAHLIRSTFMDRRGRDASAVVIESSPSRSERLSIYQDYHATTRLVCASKKLSCLQGFMSL